MAQHEARPNDPSWRALVDGARFMARGKLHISDVVDCGDLVLPVGQLIACDPFADLYPGPTRAIPVPPGRYPVRVTLFDVSGAADGSHYRVAYASLLLADRPEVTRRVLAPEYPPPTPIPALAPGEFVGFSVDSNAACFVDSGALGYGMPREEDWFDKVFANGAPDAWITRLHDPGHIHAQVANLPLPLARDGANIVLCTSGWGEGTYPTIGGYDADGVLIAVHLDFFVAREPQDGDGAALGSSG